MTINKWGGLAAFLLPLSFIVAPWIYLTGNLRETIGVLAYDLADFLSGPLLAVCLVTVAYALRERLGAQAARRMDLALLAAVVAAAGLAAVAFLRASNRGYHLAHPELDLENSTTVLVAWTTLVAGGNAFGLHFLGWMLVCTGAAGWSSRRLPRGLTVLYFLAGVPAWWVYRFPELEGWVWLTGLVLSLWQGLWFWREGDAQTRD